MVTVHSRFIRKRKEGDKVTGGECHWGAGIHRMPSMVETTKLRLSSLRATAVPGTQLAMNTYRLEEKIIEEE